MLIVPLGLVGLGLTYVLRARRDPEAWRELTQRGGWTLQFSRLDVMFYSLCGLSMVYLVGDTIFRTTEASAQTERNTLHMGAVIEKMQESSDQSVVVLAAMHAEAEAARRETAAAQRLALWVGVATAVVGAVLGGIAGAFAARVIGG